MAAAISNHDQRNGGRGGVELKGQLLVELKGQLRVGHVPGFSTGLCFTSFPTGSLLSLLSRTSLQELLPGGSFVEATMTDERPQWVESGHHLLARTRAIRPALPSV